MATYSRILAWTIPLSYREATHTHTHTHTHTSMDRGACRATIHEYMCARYTSLNIPSSQMRESQKPLRGRTHVGS